MHYFRKFIRFSDAFLRVLDSFVVENVLDSTDKYQRSNRLFFMDLINHASMKL